MMALAQQLADQIWSRRTQLGLAIRVTVADRNALADMARVAEPSKRSHVSCTASPASPTLPRIR